MLKIIRPVISSLFVFTVITGVVYPLAVTGIAQFFFPVQANGSVIVKNGKLAGSSLIGQPFDNPKFFWGRLSATSPFAYHAASSSGSNRAQTNPDLIKQVKDRISSLREADPQTSAPVPADLATSSGSGLDPHISPAAAEYQIRRVANARGLDEAKVRMLVKNSTINRTLGILGESRVNVLELNTALDGIK
jgi:potassium-transporting ATPase KdpC subunit